MPMVIAVAQQKGGAGKSTLAANLTVALGAGRRVALLDTDPQRSLSHWQQIRTANGHAAADFAVMEIAAWRLGIELDRIARLHDLVLIDTPPEIATDARQAVRVADLVLVPLQPSPPDLWAAVGTLRLAASESRPARLALNRAASGSRLRATIETEIATRNLPVLSSVIGNRAVFASAFAAGLSVIEAAPGPHRAMRDGSPPRSPAAAEMTALAAEVAALAA